MKLDPLAMTERSAQPGRQARQAHRVSPGRPEKRGLQVLPVSRAHKGNQDPPGRRGLREKRAPREPKETLVKPALPDRKVQQGLRDLWDKPVPQEQKGPQDHPD